MTGESQTPHEHNLQTLKELLPEVFSEGNIDWDKLRAALGEELPAAGERYGLSWAGKSAAFRELQKSTTATLMPAREESVNFDTTENIFIEGDNAEVLKTLQRSYFGKVKMIYIDPPYNTGNDSFIYADNFSETRSDYAARVGDTDAAGNATGDNLFRKNSKENGQYHSNWLNMMLPRLQLAKNLLRKDGVIFISIDDNEVHNLRMLMNEIFGEENFVAELIWHSKYTTSNDAKYTSRQHEYVLFFAKSMEDFEIGLLPRTEEMDASYRNPDKDSNGPWKATPLHAKSGTKDGVYTIDFPNGKSWTAPQGRYPRYSKHRLMEIYKGGGLYFNSSGGIDRKTYLSEVKQGKTVGTLWSYKDVGSSHKSNEELADILGKGMFDNPKPLDLIKTCLKVSNAVEGDIILDFFAGSGTTAQAVIELNREDSSKRKFVCVQIPEPCENADSRYTTIAEISKERIRRAGQKVVESAGEEAAATLDVGFKVFKLAQSNFKSWRMAGDATAAQLGEALQLFADPLAEGATIEGMAYELLLKTGGDLNSKIENQDGAHFVDESNLVLLLDTISGELIERVIAGKPTQVIALDRLFEGNDALKTNTVLQMRDAGISFKTV